MKIFFSDLHLGDGKDRDDFQYHQEFDETVNKWTKEHKTVEIVLLGDIFDLIRTQKYYEFQGLPHNEIKRKVMVDILQDHAPFFETLKHFIEQPNHTMRYIVGNHDFGFSLDPRLSEMVQGEYDLIFLPENYYRDEHLGIWAEHGHRYDIIDNTYDKDGSPIPYSLGDKIVIEIVDKFYEKVKQKQSELGIDPAIINDLDNVRPQTDIANWLDSIDEEGRLKQIYYDTITSFIASNFGEVANLVLEILSGKYQPNLLKAAQGLIGERLGKYIIFGHTHDALQKNFEGGARYLNSGTWRKFIERESKYTKRKTVPTYSEGGTQFYQDQVFYYYKFKSTVNLSYVLFYEKSEGKVGPRLIHQKLKEPEV